MNTCAPRGLMSNTARRRVSRYRLSSSVRIVLKRSVKTRLTLRSTLCKETSRPSRDAWSIKVCKPRISEGGEKNDREWVMWGDTNTNRQRKNNTLGRYRTLFPEHLIRIVGKQPVLSTLAHAVYIFRLHSKGFKAGFVLCSWSKAWQNTTSIPVFLFPGVYRIWNCRQVLLSPEISVCVCVCMAHNAGNLLKEPCATHTNQRWCAAEGSQ